jgi:hypothetical protein
MSVFERITRDIHSGMILSTPVKRKPFKIKSVESDKLVFFVGAKTLIPIPKAIWNDIPNFLRGQGWVRIGAKYDVAPRRTLQEYIDLHPSRGTQHSSDANYVASVLEYLKIVDVRHSQPSEVRLK